MAAEIEEVLVSLHIVELQDVAPHRGQIAFDVIDGNLEPQGEMRGRDQPGHRSARAPSLRPPERLARARRRSSHGSSGTADAMICGSKIRSQYAVECVDAFGRRDPEAERGLRRRFGMAA